MLNFHARLVVARLAFGLGIVPLCFGCTRAPDPNRYVPAPELARAALEAVLVDWQAGLPRGTIDRMQVKVEPIDNQRKKGQDLAGFEILGEAAHPGVRCFVVRLNYRNTAVDEKVRYVVLGIDPIYVYRQEDFDLLNHWDHLMPSEPGKSAAQIGAETSDPENPTGPDESQERPDPRANQSERPESS